MEIQPFSSDNNASTQSNRLLDGADSDGQVSEQLEEIAGSGLDTQQQFEHRLFGALARNGLPVALLDVPAFRDMMVLFHMRIRCPGSEEFNDVVLPRMYDAVDRAVRLKVENALYFAILLESYVRADGQRYVAVKCYCVTELWTLETCCLGIISCGTEPVPPPLRNLLLDMLDDREVPSDSVVAITSDAMVDRWDMHLENLPWPRMPCFFGVTNRAVRKALDIEYIRNALTQLNRIIGFFSTNPLARRKLDEKLSIRKRSSSDLLYDGPAWTATYMTITHASACRDAILSTFLELDIERYPGVPKNLDDQQWLALTECAALLAYVEAAWEFLRQQPHFGPGLLLYVVVRLLENCLFVYPSVHVGVGDFCKVLRAEMTAGFSSILSHPCDAIILSAFLDPRTKTFDFIRNSEARKILLRGAEQTTKHLIPEMRSSHHGPLTHSAPPTSQHAAAVQPMLDRLHSLFGMLAVQRDTGSIPLDAPDELTRYILALPCPMFDAVAMRDQGIISLIDPLRWWANNEHLYPRLAQLAERMLCVVSTPPVYTNIFANHAADVRDPPSSSHMFLFLNGQHYADDVCPVTPAQAELLQAMQAYTTFGLE